MRLTCKCGHSWDYSASGAVPADIATICPICTAGNQYTVEEVPPTEAPAPPSEQFHPGEVIGGFEILSELSRGGMGVIYKAKQIGMQRLVALKILLPDRLGHPGALRRFQREVRAAALLSHPNIVTVYHTDLEGPRPYLAMEYVPGIDLCRLVKRAGPRPIADACHYIQETAKGLQHAFERHLVHRDIKPSNLIVTPSPLDTATGGAAAPAAGAAVRAGIVKILDMGLARVISAEEVSEAVGSLTHAGEFLGTPDYIAPEQAEDPRQADIRSDLFSLGGTLYFLLAGEVPYPGTTLIQKLRRQLSDPVPSVRSRRPDVPVELDALIQKLMARDPAERFQTPAELMEALSDVLSARAKPGWLKSPAAPPPPAAAAPRAAATTATAPAVWAHQGGVRALSLSTDGKRLLSGGQDETLRLWNTERLQETRCIAGDVGPVEDVSLAPGAKWVASCALRLFRSDMVVQLWDLASGGERRRLAGHTDSVYCVAIAPDGRRVAAGSADQTIRVWTIDQPGSPSFHFQAHTGQVSRILFLPGGESLLSVGHDGQVRLWDR